MPKILQGSLEVPKKDHEGLKGIQRGLRSVVSGVEKWHDKQFPIILLTSCNTL